MKSISREVSFELLSNPKFGFQLNRFMSLGFDVESSSWLAAATIDPTLRIGALAFIRAKHKMSSYLETKYDSGFKITQSVETILLPRGEEISIVPLHFQ